MTRFVCHTEQKKEKCPFMLGKITRFLEQTGMGFGTFTEEFSFKLESDSWRLLIYRVQHSGYNKFSIAERHSYRVDRIIFWAGFSLDEHHESRVFHGGTLTGVRYQTRFLTNISAHMSLLLLTISFYWVIILDHTKFDC